VNQMKKKSLPKFRRQEWFRFKRLGEKWRKPRGENSKMRAGRSGKPPVVSIGYRSPKATRGVHPSGLTEVLVNNPRDLEGIDGRRQAVRIASGVGKRKRGQIIARTKELNLKVLNVGVEKREIERKEEASGSNP
jgi:large subunit ribosomal protein L32e